MFPETELMKMWEIDTEEYAVATGIPLEDVRDRVMTFEGWLVEQGFTIQAQASTLEGLQQAIEKEWGWRGKYIAPSGLPGNQTRVWVIDLDLTADIIRRIERGDIELGRHTVKGLQYGAADIRNKVKVETKGVDVQAQTNVDDQVTGMIVLALEGVKRIGGAWDTYLNMKKPGALPDVLEAQVNMVRRDINDTIGTLQGVLARLLLY